MQASEARSGGEAGGANEALQGRCAKMPVFRCVECGARCARSEDAKEHADKRGHVYFDVRVNIYEYIAARRASGDKSRP